MPGGILRVTDANVLGGVITTIPPGAPTVFANFLPVSVIGSMGTPYQRGEETIAGWTTTIGSPTVFAYSIPVDVVGDVDSAGTAFALGSLDVLVNV